MTPRPAPDSASAPPAYFEALRKQLVQAAARRTRRRRSRPTTAVAAAAVGLIIAGTAALLALDPGPAGAAVEVRRVGGRIELRLIGDDVSPAEVERAARREGVRLTVTHRPVGPSLANRLVSVSANRPLPRSFRRLDEASGAFRGFSVPASWPGTLHLVLGQRAGRDERYAVASDAFASGEPLECHDVRGLPASEAATALRSERPLRVSWQLQSPTGRRPTTPDQSPTAVVVGAVALARSEVVVLLAAGGEVAPPAAPRRC